MIHNNRVQQYTVAHESGRVRIKVPGHLLIPFECPKWDISNIKVVAVNTNATFFESSCPCAYIDANDNRPLRLRDFTSVFPQHLPRSEADFPTNIEDDKEAFDFIRTYLKKNGQLQTAKEAAFIDLYFEHFWSIFSNPRSIHGDDPTWVFDALLPLPQAHLYLHDPLEDWLFESTFSPDHMVKVDFAFWTGKHLVGVEIDGACHVGNDNHIVRDRRLQRAGVQMIHILNDELKKHAFQLIPALFPDEISMFWKNLSQRPRNPLCREKFV